MNAVESLVAELEQAAARLRSGELDADAAAELVERLADLAGRLGSQLDREARAAAAEPAQGQETLL